MSELEENYKKAHNWRKRKQTAHREIIKTCKRAIQNGNGNFHETKLDEFDIRNSWKENKMKHKIEEVKKARKSLRDKAIKKVMANKELAELLINQLDGLESLTGREAMTLELQMELFDE